MEFKLRKAEPRDVSDILRLVKVGLWDQNKPDLRIFGAQIHSVDVKRGGIEHKRGVS